MTTVRLVPLTGSHVPALLETMRDAEVLRFTRTPDPMPPGWLEEWLTQFDSGHRAAFAILGAPRRRSSRRPAELVDPPGGAPGLSAGQS